MRYVTEEVRHKFWFQLIPPKWKLTMGIYKMPQTNCLWHCRPHSFACTKFLACYKHTHSFCRCVSASTLKGSMRESWLYHHHMYLLCTWYYVTVTQSQNKFSQSSSKQVVLIRHHKQLNNWRAEISSHLSIVSAGYLSRHSLPKNPLKGSFKSRRESQERKLALLTKQEGLQTYFLSFYSVCQNP